jgi:hypothetical protein
MNLLYSNHHPKQGGYQTVYLNDQTIYFALQIKKYEVK